MKSSYFILFLLFFSAVVAVHGQGLPLEGSVISDSRKPIQGVSLMVYGHRKESVSDSKGRFRFDLPSSFKGGHQIKFRLLTGGWVMQNPFDGIWNLNDPLQKGIYDARIVLVPNGSPALWTHEVMTKFIDQMQEAMVQKNRTIDRLQNPSPATFEDFIAEWAAPHGYTLSDIRKELAKWLVVTEHTQDEGDLGRREFLKRNFNEAARYYLKKIDRIEWEEKELKEQLHAKRLEKFEYWTLTGDAFFHAYNLDSAKWAFGEAERVFGEQSSFDQWFTIKVADARIFDRQGRFSSAVSTYINIIDRLIESFSIDPSQTSLVYNNLGLAYQSLGEYHKGLSYYEKALSIDQENLGERHPDVARDFNNLGSVYQTLGEYQRAIRYNEKALSIIRDYYGEHHPNIAIVYGNLGSTYQSLGEYQLGNRYFEKALSINKEFFGDSHPSIAKDYYNLGSAYHSLGEHQKAIRYVENALSINKEYYGERHPIIATNYNKLGYIHNSLAEYQKAIKYFEKALSINMEFYGERHPEVAISYNNFGGINQSLGDYQKAISFFEKALSIDQEYLGERHPEIAIAYNNFGGAYQSLGEYEMAISYFEKALSIDQENYGERHPSIARDYINLGYTFESLGEFHKAIKYNEKALSINMEFYGEHHPEAAIAYNNLGTANLSLGEYHKAISYHKKALSIKKEYYGEHHPDVGISCNNLGLAYFSLGEFKKAVSYYEISYFIFIELLPANHPYPRTVAGNLANAYLIEGMVSLRQGEHATALERWRPGLDLALQVGNGLLVANYCNNIGSALKDIEEYQSALDTLDLGMALLDSLILPRKEEIKSLPDSTRQNPSFPAWERNYLFHDLRTRLRFHRAGALLGLRKRREAKRIFLDLKKQALKEEDERLLEDLKKAGY